MVERLRDLARREDGQTLIEYGMIVATIVTVVLVTALLTLGGNVTSLLHSAVTSIGSALP